MNIELLKNLLEGQNIEVLEFIENNKASEVYVRTIFVENTEFKWSTVVPYIDRRAGLNIQTEQDLAEYLISIKPYFCKKAMAKWKRREVERDLIRGSVTPLFLRYCCHLKKNLKDFQLIQIQHEEFKISRMLVTP